MTENPDPRDLDALTAEPADLDGHTIDELADYVDAGRTPPDPSIESSPSCRRAIASLERLRRMSGDLLRDAPAPSAGDPLVQAVLAGIAADARAGADFTVLTTHDGDEVVMTEGALRALVRDAGDLQPGVLVGRVRFDGDLDAPAEPLTVRLDVVVVHGVVIPAAAAALRAAVADRIAAHTAFTRVRVDIVVRDLADREE